MTEEQIEIRVERKFDRLDERFMRGELSQAEYDAGVAEIDAWAEARYREIGVDLGAITAGHY